MTATTKNRRSLPSTITTPDHASTLEERIFQDIYDAIMEHRLPPKTKLTEQVLCEIYGTARHTVRKVFMRLSGEGMVDLEANRGAFIASPSSIEVREMFELRSIIEHAVIEKVCRHAMIVIIQIEWFFAHKTGASPIIQL